MNEAVNSEEAMASESSQHMEAVYDALVSLCCARRYPAGVVDVWREIENILLAGWPGRREELEGLFREHQPSETGD